MNKNLWLWLGVGVIAILLFVKRKPALPSAGFSQAQQQYWGF